MSLTCKVGGARSSFDADLGGAVADALDHAFGSEPEWETSDGPVGFGDFDGPALAEFQERAAAELGPDRVPDLLAIEPERGGAYLPQQVRAVSIPLPAGANLQCASLLGLRRELRDLAEHWGLVDLEEGELQELASGLGAVGSISERIGIDAIDLISYARFTLAANEATRRGCPLWLVGSGV